MTPRLLKRCDTCGSDISCSWCRGFGTLPIPTTVGTPGFGSFELYRHEPCLACGGTSRDPDHRCGSTPYVPFVEVREAGLP